MRCGPVRSRLCEHVLIFRLILIFAITGVVIAHADWLQWLGRKRSLQMNYRVVLLTRQAGKTALMAGRHWRRLSRELPMRQRPTCSPRSARAATMLVAKVMRLALSRAGREACAGRLLKNCLDEKKDPKPPCDVLGRIERNSPDKGHFVSVKENAGVL